MTSPISFALSLLLAAQPAAPDVAGPGPAPEGPAAAPAVDAGAPAPATTPARPPEPRWRGTGLIVTAGIFGGIGLAANIGRVAAASRFCKDLAFDSVEQTVTGVDQCIFGGAALTVLAPVALLSNLTAFGLAAGAGSTRGRWAAHRTAFAGARQQHGGLQIGLGAGLMTAGIITYLGVRLASWADILGLDSCNEQYPILDMTGEELPAAEQVQANVPVFRRCMGRRMSGYLAGIGIGQTMSVVGVGLLTHGVAYRRNLKLMRYIVDNELRLQPQLGFGYAGLGLSGRF